jgi:cyanophycinase
MTNVLIGGGWDVPELVYAPLLTAAGNDPVVACVVMDEGDGPAQFARWESALTGVRPCRPVPVLVPVGGSFPVEALAGADALLVCGGLTPAYAAALGPVATSVRTWLASGRPYAGFSAGAVVAAGRAVVGGYQVAGRDVCPADAAEDLDEVTVVDGLGLVDFAVDVHSAQWGTLGRLCAAVSVGLVRSGVALDENTALVMSGSTASVVGLGAAHVVAGSPTGVVVRSVVAGTTFDSLALSSSPS